MPDKLIGDLHWRKWIGEILVHGKYRLLQKLEGKPEDVAHILEEMKPLYKSASSVIGYDSPDIKTVSSALRGVSIARDSFGDDAVVIQIENGDVELPRLGLFPYETELLTSEQSITNHGREYLKV
ncbi:MAG: hypothetical protein V3V40_04380 [Nitrosomonadaceae bacterium]